MSRRRSAPPTKNKVVHEPAMQPSLDEFMNAANAPRTKAAPSPQQKFQRALVALDKGLIEREDEARLVLTALLARHHVLLISPPGAAKTLIIDALCDWIVGAKKCPLQCNKDTTRSAAFGPVKMSGLKADRYERVIEGGLADAHFIVLEEIYKAGPAVLDMLLLLLSNRVYKEGVFQVKCPLLSAMAASNEWAPDGCEAALAAFFDRFLFRKEMSYVSKAGRRQLLERRIHGRNLGTITFSDRISLSEVEQAQQEVESLPWTDQAFEALWEIVESLEKKSIHPGDRRVGWAPLAAQAAAYLAGAQEVHPEHLEVLAHVLWVAPETARDAEKVVLGIANSLKVKVNSLRQEALDVVAKAEERLQAATNEADRANICTATVNKLREMYKEVRDMRQDAFRDRVMKELEEHGRDWSRLLIGATKE